VIALLPAENLIAAGLPDLDLVLPGQFESAFHRLRAAAGKEHRSATKMPAGKLDQFLRVLLRRGSGELAAVDKLQLLSLGHHRRGNLGYTMPDEVHRRRSGEIQVALALPIPDIDPLSAHRRRKRPAE